MSIFSNVRNIIPIQPNHQIQFIMSPKILILATIAILASAYTLQGNVLVLTDADFPKITQEFSHILIEFYAPWCGHCKKLAPIYTEVADELHAQGSVVRLAKIDSTQNPESAKQYGVRGYPTIYFFLNGEKMDYSGQRSKTAMVNWLTKRTRDPVSQIDTGKYQELQQAKGVSVVYHGDFAKAEGAEILKQYAAADDYNTYYFGADLGQPEGTVEIIRDFDERATYNGLDDGVKDWIVRNQRPIVVNFDERTIGQIFQQKKAGAVLFNGQNSETLRSTFRQVAKAYSETNGQPFVFTEVGAGDEHFDNLANYIKVDNKATPLVLIKTGEDSKFVFDGELTQDNILEFLSNYQGNKFGLTEDAKAKAEAEAEEL